MTFGGLPEGSQVLISSSSGTSVRSMNVSSGTLGNLEWNLLDNSGRKVSPGVYDCLFVYADNRKSTLLVVKQ